jgi:uncharacterized membrane protein
MTYSPLLILHICAGTVSVLSGAAALFARKGFRLHRKTGNVFFLAMLGLSISGAYMAAFTKPNIGNVIGGVLTLYMVSTGWAAVLRKEGETGLSEIGLLLVGLAEGIGCWILGWEAAHSATGSKDGYPAAIYYVFGSLALYGAAWDVRMLIRGGVFGALRIARHLWRMCFALFIAAASLFLGRPQIFPAIFRETYALYVLSFLPLILMIFWLIRVSFTKQYKRRVTASPIGTASANNFA